MKITNKQEDNYAGKIIFRVLIVAIIPLLVILFFYINNPDSPTLTFIANSTKQLPANLASTSPLLSKTMDVYTKTAPLLGLVGFIFSCKFLKTKKSKPIGYLLKLTFFYSIFYLAFIYSFILSPYDLTSGGKLLKIMSSNEYSLTLFYISLYAGIYLFTYLLLLVLLGLFREIKERQ